MPRSLRRGARAGRGSRRTTRGSNSCVVPRLSLVVGFGLVEHLSESLQLIRSDLGLAGEVDQQRGGVTAEDFIQERTSELTDTVLSSDKGSVERARSVSFSLEDALGDQACQEGSDGPMVSSARISESFDDRGGFGLAHGPDDLHDVPLGVGDPRRLVSHEYVSLPMTYRSIRPRNSFVLTMFVVRRPGVLWDFSTGVTWWLGGWGRDILNHGSVGPMPSPLSRICKGVNVVRWATILTEQGPRLCGRHGDQYIELGSADPGLPDSLKGLLAAGAEVRERASEALTNGTVRHDPSAVTFLPPIVEPQKVICLGLNYRDHAEETGAPIPEEPIIFSKFASSLIGHGASIVLPEVSQQVDYEAELVYVIGARCRNIEASRAHEYVAGYCVGHDVSARDWQLGKPGKQWLAGKTFDTFAPIGPELVTADEVPNPEDLGIRLSLNGQTMQDSRTSQMIFGIEASLAYLSKIMTLEPGDLVFTGTPPGVGMARQPQVWLKPGDVVEVEIDGIGMLRNAVSSAI